MRRLLALLLVTLIPFMLFSAVSYSDGVEPDLGLEEMISSLVTPRGDVDVEITSFDVGGEDMELSILVDDYPMSFVARDSEMLYGMLQDAFYYLPGFLQDEGSSIESIYGNLVSAKGDLRKGSLYYAFDGTGRRMALLRAVEELPDESMLLSPLMRRELYPGYGIGKGPVVALDLSVSSPLTRAAVDLSLGLRAVSLWEYFDPRVSLNYIYNEGEHIFQVGIGLETHANLSKMTSSSFTLLEDGEIFASVEALLGYGRGGFLPGVTYTVGYGHYFLPNAYWRIGYTGNPETGSELRLSGGVLL